MSRALTGARCMWSWLDNGCSCVYEEASGWAATTAWQKNAVNMKNEVWKEEGGGGGVWWSSASGPDNCSFQQSVTSGVLAVTQEMESVQLSFCASWYGPADCAKVPAWPVNIKQLMFMTGKSAAPPWPPAESLSTCPQGSAGEKKKTSSCLICR